MVPYKSIIYGGLQPGKAIIIQGIINGLANRFVNINYGFIFSLIPLKCQKDTCFFSFFKMQFSLLLSTE